MSEWKLHPVCELFPMMAPGPFSELKDDIQRNGQRDPITTYQGYIVDGKNRLRACEDLGIEPVFEEWLGGGSLVAWAVSRNVHRRHMTTSERAVVAQQMLPILEEEAEYRKKIPLKNPNVSRERTSALTRNKGKSATVAAKATGVSARTIEQVKAVAEADPELLEQVKAGSKSAKEAYREVKAKEAEKVAPVDELDREVVDEKLWPVFRSVEHKEIMGLIQEARSKIKDLCKDPLGAHLHYQTVDAYLKNAYSTVKFSRPYAPCPYCKTGCQACKNRRWVPKIVYDQAPKGPKR